MRIKVEVFKPYREEFEIYSVADSDISMEELRKQVDGFVRAQLPTIIMKHPTVTEVRWEFIEIGQGHYIAVDRDDIEVPPRYAGLMWIYDENK